MEFPIGNLEVIETLTTYVGENADQFVWESKQNTDKRIKSFKAGNDVNGKKQPFGIMLTLKDYPGEQAYIQLSLQLGPYGDFKVLLLDQAYLAEADAVERIRFRVNCLLFALKMAPTYNPEKKD